MRLGEWRSALQVGEVVQVRRVPRDDPWLRRVLGRTGVVIERGRLEARGYLRPPVFVVLDLGDGEQITLLESECGAVRRRAGARAVAV